VRNRRDLEVEALGDGSDFTAFQDFAGISTLSVRVRRRGRRHANITRSTTISIGIPTS